MTHLKSDVFKMEPLKEHQEAIIEYPIADLKVHELASLNPGMNDLQFNTLKDSIEERGQLVPIYIWRGKIVDGRHRTKALHELGENIVNAMELPYSSTIEDIRGLIMDTENRRHQSEAQRAIQAWSMWKGTLGSEKLYKTAKIASEAVGVSKAYIEKAEWVNKRRGSKILKDMLLDGSCFIGGRQVKNIATLQQLIKTEDEANNEAALSSTVGGISNEKRMLIDSYVKMLSSEPAEVILEVATKLYKTGKDKK